MKQMFKVTTKTIVATGLGAALFALLFMYVKIPTGIPETSIQPAYGLAAFFGALFGPIASGLIALLGHALSDALQYGSPWWSWVVASGVCGFIYGLCFTKLKASEGVFGWKDALRFNIYQIVANVVAWIVIAPVLDIVVYSEPVNLVFAQGAVAAAVNIVSAGVIGTLLLFAYSKTRSKEGSLKKEA